MSAPLPSLLREVAARGLVVFDGGAGAEDLDLNLIVQRSGNRTAGLEDDLLSLLWREGGAWRGLEVPCSADPGRHGLAHPSNPNGTAVVEQGQFRGAYARGLHKGRPALRQVGPIRIRRDGNRDVVLDPSGPVLEGMFLVEIHDDAGIGAEASEGCIVVPKPLLALILAVVERAEPRWGSRLTLTVLDL